MTEDNTTETSEDTGGDGGESNDLVNDLRRQLREKDKQLKAVDPAAIRADERSAVLREIGIKSKLDAFGLPESVSKLVDEKLEGEVTDESVTETLSALGFQVTGQDESEGNGQELEEVASLGNQVASAAVGNQKQSLTERVNAAKNPAEVAAIMAEAEANDLIE